MVVKCQYYIDIFFYCVFSCRVKRIEQKDELETEKTGEQIEIEKMSAEGVCIKNEIEKIYQNCEALKKFAMQKNIPLPPELSTL